MSSLWLYAFRVHLESDSRWAGFCSPSAETARTRLTPNRRRFNETPTARTPRVSPLIAMRWTGESRSVCKRAINGRSCCGQSAPLAALAIGVEPRCRHRTSRHLKSGFSRQVRRRDATALQWALVGRWSRLETAPTRVDPTPTNQKLVGGGGGGVRWGSYHHGGSIARSKRMSRLLQQPSSPSSSFRVVAGIPEARQASTWQTRAELTNWGSRGYCSSLSLLAPVRIARSASRQHPGPDTVTPTVQ